VRSSASSLSLVPDAATSRVNGTQRPSVFQQVRANSFHVYQHIVEDYRPNNGKTPKVGNHPRNTQRAFCCIPDGTPVFGKVNFNVPQDAGGGFATEHAQYIRRLDYVISNNTQAIFA